MPPKRKNKAATITPLKKTSLRKRLSEDAGPGQVRRNTLSTSASRLLPSVPFQMTTRRGRAKTASAGASTASSSSRRSSLNDQEALSDLEDERPAKRSRTSTDSQMSNGSINNNNNDNNNSTNGTPELQQPAPGATSTANKTAPGKKRRASNDLTQSSKRQNPRPNGVLSRTQSDVSEEPLRRKANSPKMELTNVSNSPKMPNSPEQLPDQSLNNGDGPAKLGRRLPGRRRQPHPDVNIEADLRRQLILKMSYRSLAKVQKGLLEELANRTSHNLEKDEDYHKKCPEYEPLMAQLKERRDGRVDQIDATRTYRLEQLERVRVAEERIQREQYINRFHDLQDDSMLQCYHRLKRIEREMKGREANATDDEDNVLPPTYIDEPHHDFEDRIGSKYASRSRAYVEADRELEEDDVRKRFSLARKAFVEKDEDADDSIEETFGSFTHFVGPDREEAIAHHNLTSMVDAALELERTPTPQPVAYKIQIIPNAQAFDLMMLAEISTQYSLDPVTQRPQTSHQPPQQQQEQQHRPATPPIREEPSSPLAAPMSLPSQAAHSSPLKSSQALAQAIQMTPHSEPAGTADVAKNATPARVSTHRIMDILNNDQDVPVYRSRESQPPPPQEPSTPSRREVVPSQHNTPAGSARPTDTTDTPVDQALMDALGGRPSEPPSPRQPLMDESFDTQPPMEETYNMPTAGPPRATEDPVRRRNPRDPLQKIRDLLDRKAREHGREPPDRTRPEYWKTTETPRNTVLPRVSSMQAAQDRHHDRNHDVAGYDPTRPAAGLYSAPVTAGSAYPSAPRRESQDHGSVQRERDRRMSGSQATQQQPAQSPYSTHSQPQLSEQHRTAPTPQDHHSPYALPPGSMALPPKPPGPPPVPVNFRFAHYDPAPSRQAYPSQSPTFPPGSHPPQLGPPLGPPPPQYAAPYPSPFQTGYVPPPGSFQAPPPSAIAPFPPLKIHQYGGQPILPANMAPPPHGGYAQPAYSPPPQQQLHQPPRQQQYESPREGYPGERPPDPQSRPRRQYRSYHAPGTQFRNYQGPGDGAGRRRGG